MKNEIETINVHNIISPVDRDTVIKSHKLWANSKDFIFILFRSLCFVVVVCFSGLLSMKYTQTTRRLHIINVSAAKIYL